jgi:hypothetical protein
LDSAGDKGALFAHPYYGTATAACNKVFEYLSLGVGHKYIMYNVPTNVITFDLVELSWNVKVTITVFMDDV